MPSTKIRTSIIALVASAGLAAASAPLTPVASAAKPNGGYQKSSEALKMSMYACYGDNQRYNQLVNAGEELLLEGKAGANDALNAAAHVREVAKKGGCSWAQ